LYGPWGSAKSLLALDLAAALAGAADAWFGFRVANHCPAVIVAFEGQSGYVNRILAWEKHHRRELPENVILSTPANFNLLREEDALELAGTIRKEAPGAVVFLDTMAQAAPGMNENDGGQVSLVLRNMQLMAQTVDGLVIAIHHVGKDASRGPRGYSSLEPACDVSICLSKTEGLRNWQAPKVKELQAVDEKGFRLLPVDLGVDEDGEPVSSVVIVPEEITTTFGPARRYPSTDNQRIAYEAIGKSLVKSIEFGRGDAPAQRPCVTLAVAHAAAAARMPQADVKFRNQAAKRAIDGMAANGVVVVKDGWLWLP